MAVKRKSNWYIYLIALIISFVLLGLFVSSIWDSLFPASDDAASFSVSHSDFRPSAGIKPTYLVMLSDMKAATPVYYMLANYRPRDEVIVFVPLQENMKVSYGGNEGSLYEMYDNFGAEAVIGGIKNTLGVECKHYIKFDRLSFIDFIDLTGEVYVNIPADITETVTKTVLEKEIIEVDGEEQEITRSVKKSVEETIYPAGAQYLGGERLYDYITYDFGKGVDYKLAVHGAMAMNMLNRNFRNLSSTEIQKYAEKLISSTDTDITLSDYANLQSVLLYTSENTVNPCEYYMPYGETDGGYFIISENSKATILDRLDTEQYEEE